MDAHEYEQLSWYSELKIFIQWLIKHLIKLLSSI